MPIWDSNLRPSHAACWLEPNVSVAQARDVMAAQRLARGGARWRMELGFGAPTQRRGQRIDAAIAALRGGAGSVELWDFRAPAPRGSATTGGGAAILGQAANAGDEELFTANWAPSTAGLLLKGDKIGVVLGATAPVPYLFIVTADFASDANSEGYIAIQPPVPVVIPTATGIVTSAPRALFMLASGERSTGRNPTAGRAGASMAFSLVQDLQITPDA